MSRFRILFLLVALAALATGLVACGGGDDGGGSDENPQKVLSDTFSSDHENIKSGNVDITFDIDVKGDQGGTLTASLGGPFQSEGDNKIPSLDFDAKVDASGNGQDFSFDGGLITTPDQAFVNYNGTDYEVDRSIYDQLKTSLESQQNSQQQQSGKELLKRLGINDPNELLTNVKNEGTEDVEGTDTIHVSGDLDVDTAVEALKNLANDPQLRALGAGGQLPSGSQLDQVKDAVKQAHFDVYTGSDDDILRRFTVALAIEPPSGSGVDTIDLNFDVTLSGVNEDQTIEAPANAKPLSDLLQQFGIDPSSLGQLGALGANSGGSGSTGGGSSSSGSGSSGGGAPSSAAAQKYLDCVSKANNAADLQQCQSVAP